MALSALGYPGSDPNWYREGRGGPTQQVRFFTYRF